MALDGVTSFLGLKDFINTCNLMGQLPTIGRNFTAMAKRCEAEDIKWVFIVYMLESK